MKIKEIYIKDFRQFKNFTLDLTYPKGHVKAGLPLDKVCIIGQSGTGKTNLLNLLFLMRMPGEWQEKLHASTKELIDKIAYRVINSNNDEFIISFKESFTDAYVLSENMMSVFNSKRHSYFEILREEFEPAPIDAIEILGYMKAESKKEKLIYFPAGLKYNNKETRNEKYTPNRRVFDFSKESIYALWNLIIDDVTKYQEVELKIKQKIALLAEQGNEEATKREVENLKEWRETTPSPIRSIANECLNPLIKKFSLVVKEDLSIEKKEDIGFIKLETSKGERSSIFKLEYWHYANYSKCLTPIFN